MHSRGALYAYIGAAEVVVDVDAQRHTSTMVVDSILIRMCSSIAFGHVAHISAIFRAPTTTKAAFIPFDCDEIQSEEEKIKKKNCSSDPQSSKFWVFLVYSNCVFIIHAGAVTPYRTRGPATQIIFQ